MNMTTVTFLNDSTIEVVVRDGEKFIFTTFPLSKENQKDIGKSLAILFERYFSDDKVSMIYWVQNEMFGQIHFWHYDSDRNEERKRIGSKIRQLREEKGMEAKILAKLANIDAANFSRIEKGNYSVGLDILSRIAQTLGVKVDLV